MAIWRLAARMARAWGVHAARGAGRGGLDLRCLVLSPRGGRIDAASAAVAGGIARGGGVAVVAVPRESGTRGENGSTEKAVAYTDRAGGPVAEHERAGSSRRHAARGSGAAMETGGTVGETRFFQRKSPPVCE